MQRKPMALSARARAAALLGALFVPWATLPAEAAEPKKKDTPSWLGEELPLPLAVKGPHDLALKAVAERQYLIFNLIARGKLAWDANDFATAAEKWEALLRLPGLDPEVQRVIQPLAVQARSRAGGAASAPAGPSPAAPRPAGAPAQATPTAEAPTSLGAGRVNVSGTITGGGGRGPGGTVVWLKRTDGPTPRPSPARGRAINQVNKAFVPRILPVTVGTKVAFKNDDEIFHNVFSLSRPNDFDAGLFKRGQSYTKTFTRPGPVQILCNIHASMIAFVVVVDTPWYGQADAAGNFTIRGVPPGEYELEAWHERSSNVPRTKISVGPQGLRGLSINVSGDRGTPATVPDKYGKPRQTQLGY
jgi:plastocyanin